MNKAIQIILTTCAVLMTCSAFYYLVVRPFQKDKPLRDCVGAVENGHKIIQEIFNKNKASIKGREVENSIREYATYEEAKADCYKKYR